MGTRTIKPLSNNAGQLGSDSKYWDKGYINTLHVNNLYTSTTGLTTNTVRLTEGLIILEGSTPDDFETSIVVVDPTADRIIVLPDASGTVALTSGVGVTTLNGTTVNGICTYASSGTIDVETAITATGGIITIGGTDGILTTATQTSADSDDLYLKSGSTVTGSDLSGGHVYIQSGNSTGTGTGAINFNVPKPQGTGTGLNETGDNLLAQMVATSTTNRLLLYEPGTGTDYGAFIVLEHGAMGITTSDAAAEAAHLTLDADGDIILDAVANSTTIGVIFKDRGTAIGRFNVHHSATNLALFENGGASTADYLNIACYEHGATVISTTDGSGSKGANLTISAMGNLILDTPDLHYSTSIKRRKMTVTADDSHFDHDGDVVYFGTGSTTQGEICFLTKDGSNNPIWTAAQANAESTSTSLLAIALGTDPDTDGMLLRGMVTLDHNTDDNNFGFPVYLSDTSAGDATVTIPASNNDVVRVIGYKMGNDDEIWFCPDNTWVVVSA